ncbi:MAG: TIGR03013 family XrtA/PEP-CTERM system glycosyltransferase [Sphingomonadales bacterium]
MIRIFKQYVPKSVLALGVLDIAVLFAAYYAGYYIRLLELKNVPAAFDERLGEAAHFVTVLTIAMVALGLYQRDACRDLRVSVSRLMVVFGLSFLWFAMVFYLIPDISEWRSIFIISYGTSFAGLLINRILFARLVDLNALKHRLLVLGAGERALRVQGLETDGLTHGFAVVGFLRMNPREMTITNAHEFSAVVSLVDFAKQNHIDEIITAPEERRGALPVRDLLACKLSGIGITDYSTFVERETGLVDLESLDPSWLIYSDGFAAGRFDRAVKRLFDLTVSLGSLFFTLPIFLVAALAIALSSRGPIFYQQKRVGQYGREFTLLKFRSMKVGAEPKCAPQWAQENDPRATRVGTVLRLTRIDELPQIFNVLKGDMSLVGPRPERPYFVESLTREVPYYSERHQVKPGITGWAQLNYPYGASVEDAKQKLQFDLYYIKNCGIFMDFLILIQTARVILLPEGAR